MIVWRHGRLFSLLGLADNAIVSKVNDVVWDMDRPLEADCTLSLLKWDDDDAKHAFWH